MRGRCVRHWSGNAGPQQQADGSTKYVAGDIYLPAGKKPIVLSQDDVCYYEYMTDSDSDLPFTIADERQIPVVKMPYALNGVEYFDDNGRTGDPHDFFQKMRVGASPVTSLLPTADYLDYFDPILKESDLLFLAFSSQMSATIRNIYEARDILLEKYRVFYYDAFRM